jgi:hypothetical protein
MIEKKNNARDQMPKMVEGETILAIFLIVSYPLISCNIIFLILGFLSIVRKSGYPEFSNEYLNKTMFTEEITNFTYNLAILMAHKNIFVNLPIVATSVLLLGKGYFHFSNIFPCIPGRLDGIGARGYFTKLLSPSFQAEAT